jgi:hypothetical protein
VFKEDVELNVRSLLLPPSCQHINHLQTSQPLHRGYYFSGGKSNGGKQPCGVVYEHAILTPKTNSHWGARKQVRYHIVIWGSGCIKRRSELSAMSNKSLLSSLQLFFEWRIRMEDGKVERPLLMNDALSIRNNRGVRNLKSHVL